MESYKKTLAMEIARLATEEIRENLFREPLLGTKGDLFWDAFEEAVKGSFDSGTYDLHICIQDFSHGLGVYVRGSDADEIKGLGFREMIDEMLSIEDELMEDRKAAAIADLEYALEKIKAIPSIPWDGFSSWDD